MSDSTSTSTSTSTPTPTPHSEPHVSNPVVQGDNSKEQDNTSTTLVDYTNQKVIVYNVPKYAKDNEMKSYISEWLEGTNITVLKTKKLPKHNWIVLTLSEEGMVDQLVNKLNDGRHMNKKGGVLRASKAAERMVKRERDECENEQGKKKSKITEYVKSPDEIRDAVTPLWRMTYAEQVDLKMKNMVTKCLSKIIKEIKSKIRTLQRDKKRQSSRKSKGDSIYNWLKAKQAIHLDRISEAPKKFEYRNKSEFTFGYRHYYTKNDTENSSVVLKTPAVGFLAGGWAGGVSCPSYAANIPNLHCGIALLINKFLSESPIPPYNSREHTGVWRHVTIRSSERTKQCMLVVCHAPASGGAGAKGDGSGDYSKYFESEKQRFIKMLTERIPKPIRNISGPGTDQLVCANDGNEFCDAQVTSLFFQEFDGLSNPSPQHPVQHLYGNKYIEEKLFQCTFQISPGAFFQVTTEGAEALYNIVVEKLKEVTTNPKETLLFDVCCGTGTIGITCMKEGAVGKIVGIDISEPAIKDAIFNAKKNGYDGTHGCAKFVASRAEKVMHTEIKNVHHNTPMVAVVDPARDGLHQDVCKALRNERGINRIIYVSCNPTGSLIKDAVILCSPSTKKYTGHPFKITSARPVDMFPLTDHCEMVMVFDRMSPEETDEDIDESSQSEGETEKTKSSNQICEKNQKLSNESNAKSMSINSESNQTEIEVEMK